MKANQLLKRKLKELRERDFLSNIKDTILTRSADISNATPEAVEKIVAEVASSLAGDSISVRLASGTYFPDIECTFLNSEEKFGIEVKSSKKNDFEFLGNSINESTRIEGVENIWVLAVCTDPCNFNVKYDTYKSVIKDIKITHYPRYYLSFSTNGDGILDKIGTDYDSFRNAPDKFDILRNYYRSQLVEGEELWWVGTHSGPVVIKLWDSIEEKKKAEIVYTSFVLFFELFDLSVGNQQKRYKRVTSWLVAHHSVVSPNIRDIYSAGGKVTIGYGEYSIPAVLGRLRDAFDSNFNIETIDLNEIKYYWKDQSILSHNEAKAKMLTAIENCFAFALSEQGTGYKSLLALFKSRLG